MSNRRRKSTGQRKIAEKRMIRLVRGARKHGWCLPGNGSWRDEYMTAVENTIDDKPVMVGRYSGIVLKDHALIVTKTRELQQRLNDLAGKHYGWRS